MWIVYYVGIEMDYLVFVVYVGIGVVGVCYLDWCIGY